MLLTCPHLQQTSAQLVLRWLFQTRVTKDGNWWDLIDSDAIIGSIVYWFPNSFLCRKITGWMGLLAGHKLRLQSSTAVQVQIQPTFSVKVWTVDGMIATSYSYNKYEESSSSFSMQDFVWHEQSFHLQLDQLASFLVTHIRSINNPLHIPSFYFCSRLSLWHLLVKHVNQKKTSW